jgi:long-chain acyl-CoA synthetase
VPEFERVAMWLKEKGVNVKEPEEMAVHPDVIALIKSEVQRANEGLADFERVKRHVLVPAPFSIEGGELTPSLKVRRKVVKEKYANLVDALKR